jgi:DNA-binding phage protein
MRRNAPSEFLKAAITTDGRPLTRIAREAGIDHGILVRFVNGERGMTMRTVDRVCGVLGLELRPRRTAA